MSDKILYLTSNVNLLQSEPEFRPPMSEVVQDLLDMIKRESPKSESNYSNED